MDLSKADGCSPHDLIFAKFEAYGLSKNSFDLLRDYYVTKQRLKIGSSCNFWSDVKRGVHLRTFTF